MKSYWKQNHIVIWASWYDHIQGLLENHLLRRLRTFFSVNDLFSWSKEPQNVICLVASSESFWRFTSMSLENYELLTLCKFTWHWHLIYTLNPHDKIYFDHNQLDWSHQQVRCHLLHDIFYHIWLWAGVGHDGSHEHVTTKLVVRNHLEKGFSPTV